MFYAVMAIMFTLLVASADHAFIGGINGAWACFCLVLVWYFSGKEKNEL